MNKFFLVGTLSLMMNNTYSNGFNEIEYACGVQVIDFVKMMLGTITIIGALGFFITTNPKRSHWPASIRRAFFGLFVFCNIISQAFFNVINIPNNKKMVCMLGKCVKNNNYQKDIV